MATVTRGGRWGKSVGLSAREALEADHDPKPTAVTFLKPRCLPNLDNNSPANSDMRSIGPNCCLKDLLIRLIQILGGFDEVGVTVNRSKERIKERDAGGGH